MIAYLSGFSLGLSLIIAIGSQNAFVLKHGLMNRHVFIVCFICAFSDALLIAAGVAGFGVIVEKHPAIENLVRIGGALFLFTYAMFSFRSAMISDQGLKAGGTSVPSLLKTILMCLAFTWLNPHVYLDTVVLLGSVSTQYHPEQWLFAIGAVSASFIFFFSLGFGARLLSPVFQNSRSWKILDIFVGLVMLTIALSLIYSL